MSEIGPELEPRRLIIQVMPDKELLEDFINGNQGNSSRTVYFDTEKGEFIRHGEADVERNNPQ